MKKTIALLLALVMVFALCACGQTATAPAASTFSAAQRAEIEGVIRNYLLKNPEIIRETLIELQRKEKAEDMDVIATALLALPPGQLKKLLTPEVLAVLDKYAEEK